MRETKINRWRVVVGAVLIQVCLGAIYAWSLFNQPLIEKFGWHSEDVVLTFSITIAVFAAFTILAGKVQDRIGPRWVATAGGLLLGLGLILASRATTIWELYLFYGIIGGAGIGTAYVCPLATCVKWFPDKRGLISGVAVAGFGAGSLLFKPVILFLISNFGVSETFMYLGIIYPLAIVLGAQFLILPPADYVPKGWTPPENSKAPVSNFTSGQMLKTYQFYIMWFMYLLGCVAGLMVISLAVNIGTDFVGLGPALAANAVIAIAIFNAAGRVAWGTLSDMLGRINALVVMYILTASTMFYMGTMTLGYLGFMIAVSLAGFCFGGFLALFPSLTADYYGIRNMGGNYGLVYQAYGLAAIVGPRIATSMEFASAFMIAGILSVAAAVMAFLLKPPVLAEEAGTTRIGEGSPKPS
ncbi:L-lactate MFS transporter [Desulforamulus aquiferis]|nr:OFA family MFS transporter [Desulforamulus aquiferis]